MTKITTKSCSLCGSPERSLIPPASLDLIFTNIDDGNWISLEQCSQCSALWCSSPYEPYAAFIYHVRWRKTPDEWRRIHDLDNGTTMRHWHIAMIRQLFESLDESGKQAVDEHRERAGRHNPIDGLYLGSLPDLDNLLGKMNG